MSKILGLGIPPAIAIPSAIIAALALAAGASCLLRSCSRPVDLTPQASASAAATSISTAAASQSIRITIRRPKHENQQSFDVSDPKTSTFQNRSKNPENQAQHSARSARLPAMPYAMTPGGQQNASNGRTEGYGNLGQIGPSSEPQDEEIVIEMGMSMAATAIASAKSEASASVPANRCENCNSSIGVIASTLPGCVALDYRLVGVGPIGVDAVGNHRAIGAACSIGTKAFGTGGAFLGFDGGSGYFVGGGVRF